MKPFIVSKCGVTALLLASSVISSCAETQPKTPNVPTSPPAAIRPTSAQNAEAKETTDALPASVSNSEQPQMCEVVCGGARVVSPDARMRESADGYTQQAVERADRILNGMHDDLLTCYTRRLTQNPKAHAFLTVDIVVGPTGEVQRAEALGGALLGDVAMNCILERIKRERFEAPHNGGTMHFQVPFTLRRVGPDEPI
jgi:hypothetical protein